MSQLDGLGDWRRTHYSRDIAPGIQGTEVTVFGWVHRIRDLGNVKFVVLQDRSGKCQIVVHRDRADRGLLERVERLRTQYVIAVRGEVRRSDSRFGAEIVPKEMKVLNVAKHPLPLDVTGAIPVELDKRLDSRVIDLRRESTQAIFRVRGVVVNAIREFLTRRGYVEVHTPKIIASATEGGAALFQIDYFGRRAFLAQSPQLYKEQLVGSLEKVFEIGPVFRAEKSHTRHHISEYTSIDVEEAFVTADDVMRLLKDLIVHTVDVVNRRCRRELELLSCGPPSVEPFEVLTYDDALDELRDLGIVVEWGEDFPMPALRRLGRQHEGFYFIVDWPTMSKPFYLQPKRDNPDLCEAFDLMCGWVEIASGGTRVHQRDLLVRRIREQGLDPRSFEFHLRAFDYGIPPHSGFGIGLERLLMRLTGRENIREVVLFPRDVERLVP